MTVGRPTPERLKQLMEEFYTSDGHTLYIALQDDRIAGVIGMDYTDWPNGVIKHIAVNLDMQKQNIGYRLINHAVATLNLEHIEAETDQDAADFYRACGFEVQEIKSKYPGVQRFRCCKEIVKPT